MTSAESSPLRVPDDLLDFDNDLVMRFRGRPFTGIAYEEDSGGRGVVSEVAYVDGVQDGWSRDRTMSGELIGESKYRKGVAHGPSRRYESGCLVQEALYRCGHLMEERRYEANGVVTNVAIAEGSEAHSRVRRDASRMGWSREQFESAEDYPVG